MKYPILFITLFISIAAKAENTVSFTCYNPPVTTALRCFSEGKERFDVHGCKMENTASSKNCDAKTVNVHGETQKKQVWDCTVKSPNCVMPTFEKTAGKAVCPKGYEYTGMRHEPILIISAGPFCKKTSVFHNASPEQNNTTAL